MRVALLTMLEPAEGSAQPRAFLRIGGLTVASQQVATALALQCERVICLARGLSSDLVELQHRVERAGAQFHVIADLRPLLGLVTANDELIVLADGLFASLEEVLPLLEAGQGVLVQPVEQVMESGFERIDLNHAAAGAMRIPGRLVERIGELPLDVDLVSALQRIALQAGVPQRPIPAATIGTRLWALMRSEAEAHALEPLWIRQRTRNDTPLSPGRGAALLLVRGFGPALLHAGTGSFALRMGALALVLIGLGAGWFGTVGLGLALCGIGWIVREAAGLLGRIEADGPEASSARKTWRRIGFDALLDASLIALMAWGTPVQAWQPHHDRLFPPLILVGLLWLIPRGARARWSGWLEDRALLALLIAIAALSGYLSQSVHIGAVLLLLAGILLPRGETRLTRP